MKKLILIGAASLIAIAGVVLVILLSGSQSASVQQVGIGRITAATTTGYYATFNGRSIQRISSDGTVKTLLPDSLLPEIESVNWSSSLESAYLEVASYTGVDDLSMAMKNELGTVDPNYRWWLVKDGKPTLLKIHAADVYYGCDNQTYVLSDNNYADAIPDTSLYESSDSNSTYVGTLSDDLRYSGLRFIEHDVRSVCITEEEAIFVADQGAGKPNKLIHQSGGGDKELLVADTILMSPGATFAAAFNSQEAEDSRSIMSSKNSYSIYSINTDKTSITMLKKGNGTASVSWSEDDKLMAISALEAASNNWITRVEDMTTKKVTELSLSDLGSVLTIRPVTSQAALVVSPSDLRYADNSNSKSSSVIAYPKIDKVELVANKQSAIIYSPYSRDDLRVLTEKVRQAAGLKEYQIGLYPLLYGTLNL